ncbi:DUF4328 domain-containing protein [Streptomyces antarcticus]|uniref:DUF4328 domain-containing protein n=1 Tax=Streptomyces antarcticus TaxID=2996458 RepID=UPI002270C743|nr:MULTISPECIES: DUF4328 domain-containing protein [unclassified Streptomyces]MCY0946129.1 DUF4328 domain-containing protein [Streptomyces sp. H34-AA3]MCZ4081121.1 DUF4328 domain-containing protein [Streptomyces sp. H34-S5]
MSFSAPGSPPHPQPYPEPGPAPDGIPPQDHAYPGGPFHAAPPAPQGVLRSPTGLATALTWLLGAAVAVHLFSAGAGAYEQSWMRGFAGDTHFDDLELGLSPALTMLAGAFQLLTLLPTVVVFIIWFHRVRSNGGIFRPDAFTLGRGWAIGAWFVPAANCVLPFLIARQTWRASTQRGPDGSDRTAPAPLLTSWWVVWVLSAIVGRVFSRIYMAAETVDELLAAGLLGITADLGTMTAGVLAILFVRRLTAMQNTVATQGPYASA